MLSGPAASIEPFFGDTITVSETAEDTERALTVLLGHAEYRDRIALRAHRRVFDEHLYRHRVAGVLDRVGRPVRAPGPRRPPGQPTSLPDRWRSSTAPGT